MKHLVEINNSYSEVGGGIKTYTTNKLLYFSKSDTFKYTIIVPGKIDKIVQHGNATMIFFATHFMMNGYGIIINWRKLRELILSLKPDIIEVGSLCILPWIVRSVTKKRDVQLVAFWHTALPKVVENFLYIFLPLKMAKKISHITWWYLHKICGKFDKQIVASPYMNTLLSEHSFRNIFTIPLGVNTKQFSPELYNSRLRRSIGANKNTCVFLFPNRFSEEKKLSRVISLFTQLHMQCDVKIVFCGHGNAGLKKINALKIQLPKKVYCLGYVSDKTLLAQWYASSDIIFSLCENETFGLSAIEALSSGCIIISSDKGSLSEIVKLSGAGICPSDHGEELLRKTQELVTSKKYVVLKSQARNFVLNNFGWEKTFQEMESLYSNMLFSKQ